MSGSTFDYGALSTFAVLAITTAVMRLWKFLAPVGEKSPFDALGADQLRRRNVWLDRLFTTLMFVGLFVPAIFLVKLKPYGPSPWIAGVGIGFMALLPMSIIACITLRQGRARLLEFLRYYEKRWGVGAKSVFIVYTAIASIGAVSFMVIVIGHLTTRSSGP